MPLYDAFGNKYDYNMVGNYNQLLKELKEVLYKRRSYDLLSSRRPLEIIQLSREEGNSMGSGASGGVAIHKANSLSLPMDEDDREVSI